jgi:hypothetical protein
MFLSPYLLLATMSIAMTPTVTPRYVSNSHVLINFQISPGPSFGLLSLALSTTVTAPPTAIITPSASRFRNGSFSMKGAIMQLEIKATTPSGETIDAGAKPYARKLPASPTVMRMMPAHQYGDLRYDVCLYDCSSPDDWLSPLSSDGRVLDRVSRLAIHILASPRRVVLPLLRPLFCQLRYAQTRCAALLSLSFLLLPFSVESYVRVPLHV